MYVVFSVCIETRGAVGVRVGCMTMSVSSCRCCIFVSCASCGSSQCCILHDLPFVVVVVLLFATTRSVFKSVKVSVVEIAKRTN